VNDTPTLKPTSEQSPDDRSLTKKQPRPVPATLSEFLLADKVSARSFVQRLRKAPPLADDDLARSHEVISAQPTKIGRVLELARAAGQNVPQPGALLRWCEQVLRSRDEALRQWALDPNQEARSAFTELLKWAYPKIQKNADRATRQLAESCLLLGLNLLIARRSLSAIDALRAVSVESARSRDGRRAVSSDREAMRLLVRASAKQLLELSNTVALCDGEIISAKDGRRAALALIENLQGEKSELENNQQTLNTKIDSLTLELAERENRIAGLTADVESTGTRALQDLRILKARFRRRIGEGLAGLIADAWDSIDTDPPHLNVARERLEIAREAIRKEMEWLDQSSD
jgi:hypothetical protein